MKKRTGLFALAALTALAVMIPLLASIAVAAPNFADPNFRQVWERTDKILTERTNVGRGFVWGPESVFSGNEAYAEAPGGQRLVQYYDKARMEINNPTGNRNDPNFVTSGLLVKELVLGRQQNGDNVGNFTQGQPSDVQVAGDPNTGGNNAIAPTYRSFRNLATFNQDNRVDPKLSQQVTQQIDRAGNVTTITSPDPNVRITAYEAATGHNIADVFIAYGNTQGQIWNGSSYVNGAVFFPNATYVLGLPITDPYWGKAVVAGQTKDVLIQLFERRVLTYTPTNDANSKVEMGNVGQHYYRWRYLENLGQTPTTVTPTPTTTTPPTPTPSTDYSQKRAPYLKSGPIPQGGTGNVTSYPTGSSAIDSSPVYNPDTKIAVIGTAGGGVVAVDTTSLTTPTQKWKFQPAGVNFNSGVTLFNGTIYIGGGDGKVYALKETDGTKQWETSASGGAITGVVALDVDSAYYISADGKLYAVNLSNGTPKWQNQPSGVNLQNSPIIGSDGTLYVVGNDKKVYAFKKDGTLVASSTWTPTALDANISATPAFANGKIYVGTDNGTLYALNSNGTIQTQKTFTATKPLNTTPAVANGRVYVGSDDGNVYGVDANNVANVQWTFAVPAAPVVRSSVAVVDNFVYFAAENKNVYRVEANNAANVVTLATAGAGFGGNSAVVNNGLVIIPSLDGFLHIIK